VTISVERIRSDAQTVDLRAGLIRLLVLIPWVLGWMAAKVWLGVRFAVAAIRVGWQEGLGRKPGDGP
jgi:hypothetical protein